MLIVKNVTLETEGEWFDLTVRGENIKVKVRPLIAEIITAIRKKHKRKVNEVNPVTRRMEKVEKFDEEKIGQELIDHVLEDFEGIGDAPDTPLEINIENKMRVMEIPSLENEIDVSDFVFEKAKHLAAVSEEEFRESEKNS